MLSDPYLILNIIWDVIKNWWWVILLVIFWRPFSFLWLWWRNEIWWAQPAQRMILFEVKIPKEILKPLKAMDQVFSGLWGNLYDPPDWWEKWIEGKTLMSYSFEVVSFGGEAHFFIRVPEARRNAIEATIYSEYPDAEISLADDYTKYVPADIPNKNWDLWGADYQVVKEDVYPIKTYTRFFEERPEAAKEEKRIDPYASLLEGMAKIGPGEQLWIQISATPITNEENNYVTRGKAMVDKLIKRPEKEKPKPILEEAAEGLIFGKKDEKKEEKLFWPEMMLSPGERDIVSAVENKVGQYAFLSSIRFIYLAKREVYWGGAKAIPFGFFSQFATTNLNALKPWSKSITKIHKSWFLPLNLILPRRVYLRKRSFFRHFLKRFSPLFPKSAGPASFVLSAEELATIFHFPGIMVAPAPSVSRVEAKRGEAPSTLPVE